MTVTHYHWIIPLSPYFVLDLVFAAGLWSQRTVNLLANFFRRWLDRMRSLRSMSSRSSALLLRVAGASSGTMLTSGRLLLRSGMPESSYELDSLGLRKRRLRSLSWLPSRGATQYDLPWSETPVTRPRFDQVKGFSCICILTI